MSMHTSSYTFLKYNTNYELFLVHSKNIENKFWKLFVWTTMIKDDFLISLHQVFFSQGNFKSFSLL